MLIGALPCTHPLLTGRPDGYAREPRHRRRSLFKHTVPVPFEFEEREKERPKPISKVSGKGVAAGQSVCVCALAMENTTVHYQRVSWLW